jgi:hypothetical protein
MRRRTRGLPFALLTFACSLALVPAVAVAGTIPFDPNKGVLPSNNPFDPNKGGLPFQPADRGSPKFLPRADQDGIEAAVGSPTKPSGPGTPPQGPRTGPSVPDAFTQLLASLAQQACAGNRDTIVWELPVGARNGFVCVPTPPPPSGPAPGGPTSLGVAAQAMLRSLPWPGIAINANPDNPATVAVPTYYWVAGYDGESRSVTASVPVQEGQTCTPVLEPNPDDPAGPEIQTGEHCAPNIVTYTLVVTARPASFTWTFEDDKSTITKPLPDGLGTPYRAPAWSSPIMHVFNISSFKKEAQGGFTISLSILYRVDWVATAGNGERQSGRLDDVAQVVSRPQHVQEIQVLRGDTVRGERR